MDLLLFGQKATLRNEQVDNTCVAQIITQQGWVSP